MIGRRAFLAGWAATLAAGPALGRDPYQLQESGSGFFPVAGSGGGAVDDGGFRVALVPPARIPPAFRRQAVEYDGGEAPGTIVVDAIRRHLYLVGPAGRALRYGIGVGRQGFAWSGRATIRRKARWPDWTPPGEMLRRRPGLPDRMAGGPANPLGARALYLYQGERDTLFRIHGTNEPESIGRAVSSGCIRLLNQDICDLYERVPIGTPVKVVAAAALPAGPTPGGPGPAAWWQS